MSTKTLKVRIKDKHSADLKKMAASINFVWNYINELSYRSISEKGKFLSCYDIDLYTSGSSKYLGIHNSSIQEVSRNYTVRRWTSKKIKLRWRRSHGKNRSLGWIPFKSRSIKYRNGQLVHNGQSYSIWDSFGLSGYKLKSGCFSEDARGRWYACVSVEIDNSKSSAKQAVGVDLGCKDAAVSSNGDRVEGRRYRELELKLGAAQRAKNKYRVKSIHAKIKNRRKDDLHKFSRKLVNENAAIFVGNVSSAKLVKTKMAKSVLDAGWGLLKTMLEYKCEHAGVVFEVVNEAYTTQTCSNCGVIPSSSPKGRAGLGIREWTCECGVTHDRDVNAAKNILALGHQRLAGERAICLDVNR